MDGYAKVRWRCRRGMRELDAVLEAFLTDGFDALNEHEKALFEQILEMQDPQLYAYVLGREIPEDPSLANLFERIRHCHPAQA